MKTKIRNAVCLVALTLSPMVVWGMDMGDEHHKNAEVTNETIKANGTVKSIADNHESLRIFHAPITALNWPAMNMPFDVTDYELIHSIKVGDKVDFEFVQKEGKNVIIKISK